MRYKVPRFEIKMTEDQWELERFLNRFEGEVVSIIPNARAFLSARTTRINIVNKDKGAEVFITHKRSCFYDADGAINAKANRLR